MAVARPHRSPHVRSLARVAMAAVLVGATSFGATGEVPRAHAVTVPRCAYADTLTRYRVRADWYRSLLDTRYRLSSSFSPVDLVPVTRSGASGRGSIRRIALTDLKAMYRAARAAGAPFAVQSAYRSYRTQVSTFNRWVALDGYRSALLGSARPGHSEHQLGTVLDLKTPGGPLPWNVTDWARTRAGAWIARNSWRYGFIVSYPKGKASLTCYRYEPWHVRYFGRFIAAKIHRSGLTPRQWLYAKGATTTWRGGGPNPPPAPTPTPSPSPSPSPSVVPSLEPSPSPDASPSPTMPASPSSSPTGATPSPQPTHSPAPSPTASPSTVPSASPSAGPEESPVTGSPSSP